MMLKSLILILAFSIQILCWTPGKEILSYKKSQEFDYNIFTDPTTGISHISYCNVTDRSIYYMKIMKDLTIIEGRKISTEQLCWNMADISGGFDGKNLLIAFYALRNKAGIFSKLNHLLKKRGHLIHII